ncbi:SAM-dependent methyltransferase [Paenibacillus pasadenensis]|uniref:class I SAM-dependent methyltransferase n=1 Tax=Paenibacillus pasadenensis TaxID=217090 RepID=UPI002040670F|nr:SAM-dependent methyltransferase [Paenibacillus pasadenensis]MCM3748305.1 SAM-dependent methyltransferase [Paenibacillus pasadenensis]
MAQEQWEQELADTVGKGSLLQATFSGPSGGGELPPRTVVRPVRLKAGLRYQFELHYPTKVLHENVPPEEAALKMAGLLKGGYRQALVKTEEADLQILLSKKGKAALLRKPPTAKPKEGAPAHDRSKKRVLAQGEPPAFLQELGILTQEGKVKADKQDKYRQINRFLEMVTDVAGDLPQGREITIVDFGCGKSYLTFALYHLLAIEQKRSIRVIGLDLKQDVIAFCSKLADRLGYDRLSFQVGDIGQFGGLDKADMVVTLHACDTATDAALAKAVGWQASVILSVPCCQHEAFRQIQNEELAPLLGHGLLKERFAALATDAARAALLESVGYKTQMLEFIDPEHTPKNLLIRAVRRQGYNKPTQREQQKWEEYVRYRDALSLDPALERMLARMPEQA